MLATFYTWWRRTAPATGLASTSTSMLDSLERSGPQRLSDLAARERLSQPGMTSMVSRMAADGLVERTADPADGRVVLIGITARGSDRLAGIRRTRTAELESRFARLPEADRRTLQDAAPALQRLMSTDSISGADS